ADGLPLGDGLAARRHGRKSFLHSPSPHPLHHLPRRKTAPHRTTRPAPRRTRPPDPPVFPFPPPGLSPPRGRTFAAVTSAAYGRTQNPTITEEPMPTETTQTT